MPSSYKKHSFTGGIIEFQPIIVKICSLFGDFIEYFRFFSIYTAFFFLGDYESHGTESHATVIS